MNSLQACNCKAIVKLQCSEIESARALFDLYSQACKCISSQDKCGLIVFDHASD